METKRELPTRHNFLTEAVQSYLESKNATNEPSIDLKTIITVTSDVLLLKDFQYHEAPAPEPSAIIEHIPQFKIIEKTALNPTKRLKNDKTLDKDDIIDDEYYLKRHRRHELDEKKQKNREKERLLHGYYQQKQLVERIQTMDKNLLRSIVSSIRHRTHKREKEEEQEQATDEEQYLEDLHNSLLDEAQEHLNRYEVLGIGKPDEEADPSAAVDLAAVVSDEFNQAMATEERLQRQRQIRSFSANSAFTGTVPGQRGSRRSVRNITAFGQLLPSFEIQEFELPQELMDYGK
ncbi:hypothetical protein [Parasitella parasitica]|uniref:Something about silencing protein 4 domain-containing protein n=1 Tax=Parasitella parasitica TaxID=35722 RepID=A0A0B7NBV4_9FUNG|nr:hypothetical protein [Parasitella parasitica]